MVLWAVEAMSQACASETVSSMGIVFFLIGFAFVLRWCYLLFLRWMEERLMVDRRHDRSIYLATRIKMKDERHCARLRGNAFVAFRGLSALLQLMGVGPGRG